MGCVWWILVLLLLLLAVGYGYLGLLGALKRRVRGGAEPGRGHGFLGKRVRDEERKG